MDGSAFRGFFDGIETIIWWAVFGIVCAGALFVGGLGFAIWWAIHHIEFV